MPNSTTTFTQLPKTYNGKVTYIHPGLPSISGGSAPGKGYALTIQFTNSVGKIIPKILENGDAQACPVLQLGQEVTFSFRSESSTNDIDPDTIQDKAH